MSPRETYDFVQKIMKTESMTKDEISEKFPVGSYVSKDKGQSYYKVMGHKHTLLGWMLLFEGRHEYAALYHSPKSVFVAEENVDEIDALRPTVVFNVGKFE